jgi:hypothetical protein
MLRNDSNEIINRASRNKIVIPEGFYPGSRFSGIYKLDSGQKPAGMTGFWSFARASIKSQMMFLIVVM